MAELDIGKHCSVESCKQLDFLPFTCDGCGKTFCKEHQVPDRHACSQSQKSSSTSSGTGAPIQNYRCSAGGCTNTERVAVVCDLCSLNFCLQHRHASDHSCSHLVTKPRCMQQTASHVQKILESQSDKPRGKPKTAKNVEMAAKVALMKMKQKSEGDRGVPEESRVYLSVVLPLLEFSSPQLPDQRALWFDQNWVVGRCVDLICDKCKVKNDNNKLGQVKLCLTTSNTGLEFSMQDRLCDLIQNKSLYNGSTVHLSYSTLPE